MIKSLGEGTWADVLTGEMVRYGYYDKSLVFGIMDHSQEDLMIEEDPIPGYMPRDGRPKKMVKREVTDDDGASIVAIGYLKLTDGVENEDGPFVISMNSPNKSRERGIYLLLVRGQVELYGAWKICEIDEHPMYHAPPVQQRVIVPSARLLIEAIDGRRGMQPYIVRLDPFSDSYFVSLLKWLVS